jgi:PAS domain S-box-containing protein
MAWSDGGVQVRAEHPGGGATAAREERAAIMHWTEPVNILLVDDRPENLTALVSTLDQPDYRLITATSGQEALKLVLKTSFAVILLDVLMPVMDGFEVASLIKSRERSRHIPIIFLTAAGADLSRIHQAYSLGAVDYLMKPVPPQVVRAKVGVFVELYRKTREVRYQGEMLLALDRRERERKLEELREATDRRYQDLAEAIPQLVWRANADGRVYYLSQRWCEYTGMSHEQLEGWGWLDAVHPEDVEALRARMREAMRAGSRFSTECRVRSHAARKFRWHLCLALPERSPEGEIIGWLATYTDIDEQKRADEERAELLRRAEWARIEAERMQRRSAAIAEVSRLLYDSLDHVTTVRNVARYLAETVCSACVITLVDADLAATPVAVAYRNPEAEWRLRGSVANLIRASGQFRMSFAPNDAPGQEPPGEALDGNGPMGEGFPRSDALLEVRGRVLGAISLLTLEPAFLDSEGDAAFVTDVAQRIATSVESALLYEKARRAVGTRDEFLYIASHELRTPVTSLKIQVQLLGRCLRGEGRVPFTIQSAIEKVRIAEEQIDRLSLLISALLDVSRIGAGKLLLSVREVDLAQVARAVAARFADDAALEGTQIEVIADEPVLGRWDAMRVEQVVTNLISNALKYGRGSPVEISVHAEGTSAVLVVRDHGIGIAKEDIERIFDRFERAVSPTAYGGLGLGLYIARHVVEAHGGMIEVHSEPGAGAEFCVTLPLDGLAHATAKVESTPAADSTPAPTQRSIVHDSSLPSGTRVR